MELPKVNIAVIGIICSSLGGMVWYASEQASIIANLEETVAILDAQSNTADKVNMIRDIDQNKTNINEIVGIMADSEADLYKETDELWDEIDGMTISIMRIVELQQRVALLEKTLEFITRDHKDMLDPRH
jgi:streptogramin lyase|tara:strand:- start:5686 stop:6075 length:390 start_codon:yes stop_codon:yes gene_type:complete